MPPLMPNEDEIFGGFWKVMTSRENDLFPYSWDSLSSSRGSNNKDETVPDWDIRK